LVLNIIISGRMKSLFNRKEP